jgi:hypothetical protein
MVDALVAADPPPLVKTARNSQPFSKAVSATVVMVVVVAPGALIQVLPPSTDTCQRTVDAGMPLAAAVKVNVPPATTHRARATLVCDDGEALST